MDKVITSIKSKSDEKTSKRRPKTYANNNTLVLSESKAHESAPPGHDQITAMAYKLWCERGGNDLENWLEAERRLQKNGCE
jgi:hypothetical protein